MYTTAVLISATTSAAQYRATARPLSKASGAAPASRSTMTRIPWGAMSRMADQSRSRDTATSATPSDSTQAPPARAVSGVSRHGHGPSKAVGASSRPSP